MRKNTKYTITEESKELEEGKLANSLMLSLSLMLSGLANTSCSMVTPIEAECEYGCVGCYNKITDDQTVDILKKYFDKAENKFILNHLIDSHSGGTTMLGATQMAIYNIDSEDEWFTAEIKLNDNFIKKYSRLTLHLPDEFTRGLVIIHELCHVLHYRDSHNSNWLNDFKSKIEEYCWDCIDDDLVEYHGENKKYETPQELINFIIDEATSQYIKESIRKSIKESIRKSLKESTDDTLFILSSAEVEVYEDSYEEGEGDYVNSYGVNIRGRYTLKELMKELSSWGFSDNPKDYMWWNENGYSELMTDVNLCEDGTEPSKSELEQWENGELQLYVHRFHGHLQMIKVRDLDYTDARECGFDLA